MNKPKDYKEWLDQKPESVAIDSNGYEYIPPAVLEEQLDHFDKWEHTYFKCDIEDVGRDKIAIASASLVVCFDNQVITRKGAYSCKTSDLKIENWHKTLLEKCIADAAKSLGRRFGRYFNYRQELIESEVVDNKGNPSSITIGRWRYFKKNGMEKQALELEKTYNFKNITE